MAQCRCSLLMHNIIFTSCFSNDYFALIFYRVLFKEGKRPIYFLLLVGMIVGTFLGSVTTFFQVLIDPNEFLSLQSKMFASFNNVNSDLVWLAGIVILIAFIFGWRHMSQLDVMSLGRDTAINLGYHMTNLYNVCLYFPQY